MIIEITNNKKTNNRINIEKLDDLLEHFKLNIDVWFTSNELENVIQKKRIRSYINELRSIGVPVVSSKYGYKLTYNKDEIKKCYEELRMRALRALTAAKCMKNNL